MGFTCCGESEIRTRDTLRHDNGELGAFLDLIKMGGASIPVRSMVTPTSKGWTLANLLLELNTEHETVQGGNA